MVPDVTLSASARNSLPLMSWKRPHGRCWELNFCCRRGGPKHVLRLTRQARLKGRSCCFLSARSAARNVMVEIGSKILPTTWSPTIMTGPLPATDVLIVPAAPPNSCVTCRRITRLSCPWTWLQYPTSHRLLTLKTILEFSTRSCCD